MENPVLHRTALDVADTDTARAARLSELADRLERTLAHQLIELGPMAWVGPEAAAAVDRLRACAFELTIAAAGLRATANRIGGIG